MTVTHEQMIEAQLKTGRSAMELLESVAEFGKELQFSAKKPYDLENDEFIELRMKTEHFGSLVEMFTEIQEWVKGIVSFDSLEDINANCSTDSAAE